MINNPKIIQICGYMHTSTTLIGAMLESGDSDVKFVGELQWLEIGDKDYSNTIYDNVYSNIHSGINPYVSVCNNFNVSTVIDSSKMLEWTSKQNHNNNTQVIIVYKSPYEIVHSMYKRGVFPGKWMNAYADLYCGYLKFNNKVVIRYKDLVSNSKNMLMKLCNFVNIPYFETKELYWKHSKINVVAGCSEIMNNYFEKSNPQYTKRIKYLAKNQNRNDSCIEKFNETHRKIYYNDDWKLLPANIKQLVNNSRINNICQYMDKLAI